MIAAEELRKVTDQAIAEAAGLDNAKNEETLHAILNGCRARALHGHSEYHHEGYLPQGVIELLQKEGLHVVCIRAETYCKGDGKLIGCHIKW